MTLRIIGRVRQTGRTVMGDLNAFIGTTWSTNTSDYASAVYTLDPDGVTVTHDGSATALGGGRAVHAKSSGKWYFEVKGLVGGNQWPGFGISSYVSTSDFAEWWNKTGTYAVFCQGSNTDVWNNGVQSTGVRPGTNSFTDTYGFAYDLDNGAWWLSENGVWVNGASLAEIEAGNTANAIGTISPGTYYPIYMDGGSPAVADWSAIANFGGDTPFDYTVPAGFATGWSAE